MATVKDKEKVLTTETTEKLTTEASAGVMKEQTLKVYIVYSPVANYCGTGAAGVQFAYGKAEVNEGWVLEWYKARGYKVEVKQ